MIWIVLIIASLIIGIIVKDRYEYNKGIHRGCGGHWIMETLPDEDDNTFWTCDKCGKVIETVTII